TTLKLWLGHQPSIQECLRLTSDQTGQPNPVAHCVTSARFLDAGQLSLRSLFVAGVQKPSDNQTQAPQQRSRIECIIPSANVRGATAHYSETRVIVVESEVPSESAPGKTLIDRADFSDAYRAPQ